MEYTTASGWDGYVGVSTEVAVPQPWRDLMQEQKDRITTLEQQNAKLIAALKEIEVGNMDRIWCALKARAVLKELGE